MEQSESPQQREARIFRTGAWMALVYVLVAAIWITLSDLLLTALGLSRDQITRYSILKGWGFVVVTGLLLYYLLRRHAAAVDRADRDYRAGLDRAEKQKREFFENTVAAITEGKLLIREPAELAAMLPPPEKELDVSDPADAQAARSLARNAARALGIPDERAGDFIVAVGEAVINAVKHAGGGVASAHADTDRLWIRIADHGPGIADLMLPQAVLERGFSTKPSLGMGYTLMLAMADHIYLNTGPAGTTVVLELQRVQRAPEDTLGLGLD